MSRVPNNFVDQKWCLWTSLAVCTSLDFWELSVSCKKYQNTNFILHRGDDTGWHKLESQPGQNIKEVLFLFTILMHTKDIPDVSRLVRRAEDMSRGDCSHHYDILTWSNISWCSWTAFITEDGSGWSVLVFFFFCCQFLFPANSVIAIL